MGTRIAGTLVAGVLIATAGPCVASNGVQAAATGSADVDSAATRLARLVLPVDGLLAARMPRFEKQIGAELRDHPDVRLLERATPGVTEDLRRRMPGIVAATRVAMATPK